MGLALLAHYFDSNEALIVGAALDAAGIPNFIENYRQISIQPFYEIALGGHRLMVCEEDLADAIAVLDEARRKRSFEGERLSQRTYLFVSLLLLLVLFAPMPIRTSKWRDVNAAIEAP